MKKLLALGILAMGLPTLFGAQQVQNEGGSLLSSNIDTSDLTDEEKMDLPSERSRDLCQEGVSKYFDYTVLCTASDIYTIKPGTNYTLGANITLAGHTTIEMDYNGKINGRGRSISYNNSINPSTIGGGTYYYYGLFTRVVGNSTIKNIDFLVGGNRTITTDQRVYVGGLAGVLSANNTDVTISNVTSKVQYTHTATNSLINSYMGGLFGRIELANEANVVIDNYKYESRLLDAPDSGDFTNNTSYRIFTGGLAGELSNTSSTTKKAYLKINNINIKAKFVGKAYGNDFIAYFGGVFGGVTAYAGANIEINKSKIDVTHTLTTNNGSVHTTREGGIVGFLHIDSNASFKLKDSVVKMWTSNNTFSTLYSGNLFGSAWLNAAGSIEVDSVVIDGHVAANENKSYIGGTIGYYDGGADAMLNVSNIIVKSYINASYFTNPSEKRQSNLIGYNPNGRGIAGNNRYYLSTNTLNSEDVLLAADTTIDPADLTLEFFESDAINLDLDIWHISADRPFMSGGNMNMTFKTDLSINHSVGNDFVGAPNFGIEEILKPVTTPAEQGPVNAGLIATLIILIFGGLFGIMFWHLKHKKLRY